MEKKQRDFIIQELMNPDFIEYKGRDLFLIEREESGKSELSVHLASADNLCIANIDKKNTKLYFFQEVKSKALHKRVDHVIFEKKPDHTWCLHLIEMKGSVGSQKWFEIKGKFRASYLLCKALAGMLELEISEVILYTTFERVQFGHSDTQPTARRSRSGIPLTKMEDEWNGHLQLNFGEWLPFLHKPIQMTRNKNGILVGYLK